MKIKSTVETKVITPEMASEMLKEPWNEQRNITPTHVARLVDDMIAGRFRESTDCILLIK